VNESALVKPLKQHLGSSEDKLSVEFQTEPFAALQPPTQLLFLGFGHQNGYALCDVCLNEVGK